MGSREIRRKIPLHPLAFCPLDRVRDWRWTISGIGRMQSLSVNVRLTLMRKNACTKNYDL